MFKFFFTSRKRRNPPVAAYPLEERLRWLRDPYAHPDIAAMSPRELADLPPVWRRPGL